MRKILRFFLLLSCLMLLVSCMENSDVSYLKKPELLLTDNVLSWHEVLHADYYEVYDGYLFYQTTEELAVSLDALTSGVHTMKVIAKSYDEKYLDSKEAIIQVMIPEESEEVVVVTNTEYSVFMINDTHGAYSDGSFPSIARVASILDELDENTIKIMNGDAFQGSYESNAVRGLSILEALNAMHFDAFVIGNHEFDWGFDEICKYKDGDYSNGEAEFPFLGCNIIDKATNQMVDFLEPYTIVDVDGLKVGIIGVIGYNLESSIMAKYVEPYDFVYPLELIKKYTAELRTTRGCDSVIVSIHDYDEDLNSAIGLLKGNYQVDGILCGHTHQHISETVSNSERTIPVVQNQSQNKTAIAISFDLADHSFVVKTYYPSNYPLSDNLSEILNKYQYLADEAKTIIKNNNAYISRQTLGTIAVGMMKDYFDADVAMMNTAGIRNYISSNITYGSIYEVFPFDNRIIIVTLKGSELLSLYQSNADYLYISNFNFNSVKRNNYYKIAVIDYVFFSPYYKEFKNIEYEYTEILLRDLMIEYYQNN